MESDDDELVDQLPLWSWHGVTFADRKRHGEEGEFPAELYLFKKLQIDVQGKKISNFSEKLCNMKKGNVGLVGTFGYDAALYPWNTFYSEGRRENVNEECQPCPDENSSKRLESDWCDPNAATDD